MWPRHRGQANVDMTTWPCHRGLRCSANEDAHHRLLRSSGAVALRRVLDSITFHSPFAVSAIELLWSFEALPHYLATVELHRRVIGFRQPGTLLHLELPLRRVQSRVVRRCVHFSQHLSPCRGHLSTGATGNGEEHEEPSTPEWSRW